MGKPKLDEMNATLSLSKNEIKNKCKHGMKGPYAVRLGCTKHKESGRPGDRLDGHKAKSSLTKD